MKSVFYATFLSLAVSGVLGEGDKSGDGSEFQPYAASGGDVDDPNCNPICTPTRPEPLIPDGTCDCDVWGDPHYFLMGDRLDGDDTVAPVIPPTKITPEFTDAGTYVLSKHDTHAFAVQIQTDTCKGDKLCISRVGVKMGDSFSAQYTFSTDTGLLDSYGKRVSFTSNKEQCRKWREDATMVVVNQGVTPCTTYADCPPSDPAYATLGRCKAACLDRTGCVAIQFSSQGCAFKSTRLADTDLKIPASGGETYWERLPCGYFDAGDGVAIKAIYDDHFPQGRFFFVDYTKGTGVEIRTGALETDGLKVHVSVPESWNDALAGQCGTCKSGLEFLTASGTTMDVAATPEELTSQFFSSWEIDPEDSTSLFRTV
jgi:hypothetical protein